MTYSETVQSYVTTAVGLAPEESLEGRIAVTSTAGIAPEVVDFVRAYVPNDGPQTIRAADGSITTGPIVDAALSPGTTQIVASSPPASSVNKKKS